MITKEKADAFKHMGYAIDFLARDKLKIAKLFLQDAIENIEKLIKENSPLSAQIKGKV